MKDYIGDGVYIHYDGYGITLNANDAINPTDSIYLEPEVCSGFLRFIETIKETHPDFARQLEKGHV